jgi:hypothetical protein
MLAHASLGAALAARAAHAPSRARLAGAARRAPAGARNASVPVLAKKRGGGEPPRREVQLNPNSDDFWRARGYRDRPDGWQQLAQRESAENKARLEEAGANRGDQLNPSHEAYWLARGYDEEEAAQRASEQ